eukprot:6187516-Pleurochrysis_carterae.AAC.1
MAAVGTPAAPSRNVQAHAIARLTKANKRPGEYAMSTRDKAFQESFLRMTRREQSANTAPSVALDNLSMSRRGHGEKRGEPVATQVDKTGRTDARMDTIVSTIWNLCRRKCLGINRKYLVFNYYCDTQWVLCPSLTLLRYLPSYPITSLEG